MRKHRIDYPNSIVSFLHAAAILRNANHLDVSNAHDTVLIYLFTFFTQCGERYLLI